MPQGETSEHFYVIESGTFHVLKDSNKIAEHVGEGSFGDMALFCGAPCSETINSASTGRLWQLSRSDYDNYIRHSISVAGFIPQRRIRTA